MARPLKVLYISHYFPPEVNAPALRVSEMANRWAENGADVTVLTGFPNHPTGIIPDEYKGMKRHVTKFKKLKVIRTWLYAAPNKGFLKRILNYLSFMFSSVVLGTSKVGKPDIIIATSPQFFVAVAGYVISRIKRSKFVFEIRDVWPEEIVAVGAIKNRFIIKSLEMIEMFLYRKADLLVAVAQGTIDILTERGIDKDKMVLYPNGVNIDHFTDTPDGTEIRKQLGFENKFIISYVGTHGMAHKLEDLLEVAKNLSAVKQIQFLFVGDGARKKTLISLAEEMKLTNVYFHDQISHDRIPEYYKATDLFMVPLRQAKLFTKNIPSKIYEIMAVKKPILISTEGESRKLVEQAGAGVGCTPESVSEMTEKIMMLYNNEKQRMQMGSDGYSFVLANASRIHIADNYLKTLTQVVEGNRIMPIPSHSTEKEYTEEKMKAMA